jgi:2-polyprenyl-3-methyl-5-hydroxy-6-metoxy-1,4-benzoquinol methylase
MQLNNSWNSKTIQKQLLETRTKYSDLYRGEKYLISKFIKNNDSVLDIGCGQGGLFKILNKKYKNISYTGIDFNKNMIEFAKSNYSEAKFYYSIKNDYMKFFKKKFDVVIVFGILHLNSNWRKILINASKVARRAIIFDHRIELEKNIKKNFYLDLDFINKNKKFRIDYFLLKKNSLENFLELNMKKFNLKKLYYNGYASKFSNIKNKITFANLGLSK